MVEAPTSLAAAVVTAVSSCEDAQTSQTSHPPNPAHFTHPPEVEMPLPETRFFPSEAAGETEPEA